MVKLSTQYVRLLLVQIFIRALATFKRRRQYCESLNVTVSGQSQNWCAVDGDVCESGSRASH